MHFPKWSATLPFSEAGEDSGNYNSIVPFTTRAAEKDFTDRYEERYGSAPSPLIAFQIHWTAVLGSAVPTKWMKDGCAMSARELADMFTTLIPQELFKALNVDWTGMAFTCQVF